MEIRMEADGRVLGRLAEVMEMFVADTQSRQSEWNDRVRDGCRTGFARLVGC